MTINYTITNVTLKNYMSNSSSVCIPPGYDQIYPEQSIQQEGWKPNYYYKLMYSFAFNDYGCELFTEDAAPLLTRPYSPLNCDSSLLPNLKNILGLQFITEELADDTLRSLLYAKLLANTNDGTIANTMQIYKYIMDADSVFRIRLGIGTVDVSYTSIGGALPISLEELATMWDDAVTAGIYIELRQAPLNYFGFDGDPNALGFSSIDAAPYVESVNPYFGFAEDPDASGFSSVADLNTGGNFPVLVQGVEGGGSFTSIIYNQ